jgi:membrane protein
MAAAIAFYTVWSLPATLVLVVWIAGLAFGDEIARTALVVQVSGLIGPKAGAAVREIIGNASVTAVSPLAAFIGGLTLVLGATTVFNQIHQSLNVIWRVDGRLPGGILQMLKTRVLSFSVILSIGFLMLVSLAVSAGTSAMAGFITTLDRRLVYLVEAINTVLSVGLTFLLFGLIYKILPTVRIEWRQVWLAALATAVLFTAGKYIIALYIGRTNVASMFGAASVVIVIILWVYYSASIMLLGAEFSKAYSRVPEGHDSGPPLG